ncbi:hypothetical protein QBC43DRAFT_208682 [Cladorrhinum sp. PSN259]|nr:hypothetical protein QBC43DRAFT_208682 [Cladorrhinum sp. PSN259]
MSLTLPSLPTTGSSSSSTPAARRSSKPPQISPAQRGGNGSAKKRKRSEEEDVKPSIFDEDDDLIDLVDKEEVPEGLRKEKQYTKLRDFTCIICYEEVTDLTVTFCGHMFCAGCLHSALTVDPARRVCPVCRQKVDKEPAHASFGPRAKGFFPLKLKLRSRKEVERRKQRRLNHDDSVI